MDNLKEATLQSELRFKDFMGYMQEKSVSSGKNDHIFTTWHQKGGKKGIHANPKLFKPLRKKMPKLCKFRMPGPSYASKAGPGCYRKSMKLTRLFVQNARGQCRLWR